MIKGIPKINVRSVIHACIDYQPIERLKHPVRILKIQNWISPWISQIYSFCIWCLRKLWSIFTSYTHTHTCTILPNIWITETTISPIFLVPVCNMYVHIMDAYCKYKYVNICMDEGVTWNIDAPFSLSYIIYVYYIILYNSHIAKQFIKKFIRTCGN